MFKYVFLLVMLQLCETTLLCFTEDTSLDSVAESGKSQSVSCSGPHTAAALLGLAAFLLWLYAGEALQH